MKRFFAAFFAGLLLSMSAVPSKAQTNDPDSVAQAAAAILGTALKGSIENIEQLGIRLDRPALMKMLGEIVDGREPAYTYQRAYEVIDTYVNRVQQAYVDSVFSVSAQKAFVDSVGAAEGSTVTPSGLVFRVITEGEGVNPASGDDVRISYIARLSDGSEFDRTEEPVVFDVDRFVPGFTEGLKMMRPGGRYQVIIPASLGYGERGVPGAIPPNAALDFTVDLLQVIPKPSN